MKDLKGTKTEKNLQTAFAGEAQARTKYDYFASQAKKDGYEQVAAFFTETSGNEKEHAKLWFKYLQGGTIQSTEKNLVAAAEGEHYEWTDMYKTMAEEADAEGFPEIAAQMRGVLAIEKGHEQRYLKLVENIRNGEVFARKDEVTWQCRNCGHIVVAKEAPKVCPVCKHPQSYFEVHIANY